MFGRSMPFATVYPDSADVLAFGMATAKWGVGEYRSPVVVEYATYAILSHKELLYATLMRDMWK